MKLNRRTWLRAAASVPLAGWLGALAAAAERDPARKRSCILLWMAGGPSQTDTFDLKPDHANGGPFKEIETNVSGVRISEHLPALAKQAKHLAVVRSMSTREGDHGRASQHLRTGYLPQGSIQFPTLGALVAHESDDEAADLPGFVSVGSPGVAVSPGFLGPRYAPLVVGGESLRVENLERPQVIGNDRAEGRLGLMRDLEAGFLDTRTGVGTRSHRSAYDRAVRLMRESAARAFDLDGEPAKLRDAYGRSTFGQGCLLARRLVERGVPFVEVTLGGWDTHDNNFEQVKRLSGTLDSGFATLIADLKDRGLLETTTIVWMGEFGRTPVINPRNGRDHYPAAWSIVLGGGGIRGGQAVGRTGKDGLAVEERPMSVSDLLATLCQAIGLDPTKQNLSNVNRPIRLVDPSGKTVKELLA
jgi:uncharacterized protein (DUF1501 family)